jgi:hypothetical protein
MPSTMQLMTAAAEFPLPRIVVFSTEREQLLSSSFALRKIVQVSRKPELSFDATSSDCGQISDGPTRAGVVRQLPFRQLQLIP